MARAVSDLQWARGNEFAEIQMKKA
jgi:hypothetical protein